MSELYKDINAHERSGALPTTARPAQNAPKPPSVLPFSEARARALAARTTPRITREDLRAASPITIPTDPQDCPSLFLSTCYTAQDNVLIFDTFRSQGQYMWHGKNQRYYKLSHRPNERAQLIDTLPLTHPQGMWYLVAPVTGKWQDRCSENKAPSRRTQACATRFPYAVIESDELPEDVWLRILPLLKDDITALYTSGGKSIHALIRNKPDTAENFARLRQNLIHRLTPIGADRAAITSIRLSRLAGAFRAEKQQRQELLWLKHPDSPLTLRSTLNLDTIYP